MRAFPAIAVAALLVLAGCAAPPTDGPAPSPTDSSSTTPSSDSPTGGGPTVDPTEPATTTEPPVASGSPPDPPADVLGWEDGVWHNESLAVNRSGGLSDAELDAVVSRAMARVERIRGLEFDADVPVEVVSRESYRNDTDWVAHSPSRSAWTNQVWEALFVVDEGTDASTELAKLYGSNVQGFYAPSNDRLVVVSDGDGPPTVDRGTLVHELVHALQDQEYDLTAPRYRGGTRDAELASQGLTEGEANYVQALYEQRCGAAWDCPSTASGGGGGIGAAERVNLGLLATIYFPYSDGPAYVHDRVEADGWAAVDDAHADPPAATEQVIHPGRDDEPADVTVPNRARAGWERFEYGSETVGEAAIATMLWYQTTHYRIRVDDVGRLFDADGPYDAYNYTSAASAGWAGDALVPYRRGDEGGYVWATEWDSRADAREFHRTYREILRGHGAERRGEYTWVVPEGGYADAFHVRLDGTRVTVVNAPTVAALSEIRPGLPTGPVPAAESEDGSASVGAGHLGGTTGDRRGTPFRRTL